MLADNWVLLVLGTLRAADGPVRFDELRGRLDGIAQKMLTKTPRDLERDGLVRRSVYPTVPPRVEHSITELGTDLSRITHAVGLGGGPPARDHCRQSGIRRRSGDRARAGGASRWAPLNRYRCGIDA
ncbi:winged helix-turn-helix transcriptional regulator [Nocardia canadensis]|uniref:winged helix-turn-helix transcriptional regulator n=1 Tax=Nocardia canadensis TaxID=3065238 RepID=UPI00292D919D|nr:helix-turn-helix domain-containing protein [Nocardia canadensis]